MGFQNPPSLPDYSKLTFQLNSSGVQKWNPAVYDLLKNLITAVSQSQDVVIASASEVAAFGGVTVDPNGAILGDGVGVPLKVNPDGTTITIIGNQLVATAGAVIFNAVGANATYINGIAGPAGFTIAANTVLGTIVGVPGAVIIPLKLYVSCRQTDALLPNAIWGTNSAIELVYNMAGFPNIATSSAQFLFTAIGLHEQTSMNEPVSAVSATSTINAHVGKDVLVRTTNVGATSSTANKGMTNGFSYGIPYVVLPVTSI